MRSAHNGTATHVCPHCRTQRGSVMPHVAANWDRFGCGQKCQPTEQGIREVAARAKALPQHGTPQQATAADADQPMDVAGAAGDGGGGAEVVEALDGLLAGVEATAGGAACNDEASAACSCCHALGCGLTSSIRG